MVTTLTAECCACGGIMSAASVEALVKAAVAHARAVHPGASAQYSEADFERDKRAAVTALLMDDGMTPEQLEIVKDAARRLGYRFTSQIVDGQYEERMIRPDGTAAVIARKKPIDDVDCVTK
jgi:hypothetical protein